MVTISPSNQLPFPGTPLFSLLSQGIGRAITVHTANGEITGVLSRVNTGFITVIQGGATELHIVFGTVISFSFA